MGLINWSYRWRTVLLTPRRKWTFTAARMVFLRFLEGFSNQILLEWR